MILKYYKILTNFRKEEKNKIGIYYTFFDSHTDPHVQIARVHTSCYRYGLVSGSNARSLGV